MIYCILMLFKHVIFSCVNMLFKGMIQSVKDMFDVQYVDFLSVFDSSEWL